MYEERRCTTLLDILFTDPVDPKNEECVLAEYTKNKKLKKEKWWCSLIDYTSRGFYDEFDEGDSYQYDECEALLPTIAFNKIDKKRIHYYENLIQQEIHPTVLLFRSHIDILKAGYGLISPDYIIEGHHKLLAYQNQKVSPTIAILNYLPTEVEFDAEKIANLIYSWQMKMLLRNWYNKDKFVEEIIKNPTSKLSKLIKNGSIKEYYTNGNLKHEAFYIIDKIDGRSKEWYESGTIKREAEYRYGLQYGDEKIWNENGTLLEEGHYTQGCKTGVWKNYTYNGNITKITPYNEQGKLQSKVEEFHPNGQKKSELAYDNGSIKDGIYHTWFKNGSVETEKTYYERVIVEDKKWNASGELIHHEKWDNEKEMMLRIPTEYGIEQDRIYRLQLNREFKSKAEAKRHWENFRLFIMLISILGLLILRLIR